MKKMLFLVIVFLPVAIFSQTFNVSLSKVLDYKTDPRLVRTNDGFITYQETELRAQLAYTFKLENVKFGIRLIKYDKEMHKVLEKDMANGGRDFGPLEPVLKFVNNKPYLFYYQFSGDEDNLRMKLMVAPISEDALTTGTPIEILDAGIVNTGWIKSVRFYGNSALFVEQSPDKKTTAVVFNSSFDGDIYIKTFDKEFRVLKEKKQKHPGTSKIEIFNVIVTNAADLFISYRRNDQWQNYLLTNAADNSTTEKMIKLKRGTLFQVLANLSPDGNKVYLTGTYIAEKSKLTGIFSIIYDVNTAAFSAEKLVEFPVDLVEKFDKDGWCSSAKKVFGVDQLTMRSRVLSDGSISMAGEFRAALEASNGKGVFEYSGSILSVIIKDDHVSFARIPKYRRSANAYGGTSTIGDSFFLFSFKDKTVILYDDHEENVKRDPDMTPTNSHNYKNSVLVAAVVDKDGKMTRQIILDESKEDYLAITESIDVLDNNKLLIPVQRIRNLGGIHPDFKWATLDIAD